MKPKSTNTRQAERRQKMRDAGFVLTQLWVHEDDVERVKKYVNKLRDKHLIDK